LEEQGRTSKTITNELTTLLQCARWLVEEGHLPTGEPIKLKLKKIESRRAYCYRPQEVAAMVAHCRADARLGWLGDVVVGLACSGMRIAELTGLKWSDVDLEGGWITLTDETGHEAGSEPRRALKSGRSRSVPIDAELRGVLERLSRMGPRVLLGPTQRALKSDYVRRKFVKYVVGPLAAQFPATPGKLGFADGRLHSFRHAFVSRCAAQNVAELIVMDWVGHADSSMVRWYFHLSDEEAQRQMRRLNFLGNARGRSDGVVSKS
jgi:integrase